MKYLFFLMALYISGIVQKSHPGKNDIPRTQKITRVPLTNCLTIGDSIRYAFFEFDSNRDGPLFDKDSFPANLSGDEVKTIEKLINERVFVYNGDRKSKQDRIKRPKRYYKQFITVVTSKKEKLVWVNCMCEVTGNEWKKSIPITLDGGSCYFQVKINLTQNIVYYFSVNGVA